MASQGPSNAAEASSAPTKVTKPRRRRVKRDGEPPLQFVVATSDLSHFRDEEAKRSVRSQAMMSWRHREKEGKRVKNLGSSKDSSSSDSPARSDDIKPSIERLLLEASAGPSSSHVLDEPAQGQQRSYSPTYLAWWGSATVSDNVLRSTGSTPYPQGEESSVRSQSLNQVSSNRSPSYGGFSLRSFSPRRTVDYEESDEYERQTYSLLLRQLNTFYHIGNGSDPFGVIPQFANPELSSLHLTRSSVRSFTSEMTMKKWFPAIVSNPHMILSSTCLVSTWLDMKEGHSGDSKRTAMVKEETFAMINKRIQDPLLQSDDTTLMAILHVLAGEMWGCNENTLTVHIHGVAQFIHQRGGLESLGGRDGALADVAVSCCIQCNILYESEPLHLFHAWEPNPVDLDAALPESPAFCPNTEFRTIRDSTRCSSITFGLLCDMRDLTRLFLENSLGSSTSDGIKREDSQVSLNYSAMVAGIQQRVVSLPSAYTPGLPVSNDWVYESCRIAALIYTAAILWRVPFSVAAGPSLNSTTGEPAPSIPQPRLVESLYKTLERADTLDLWDDMAGVLFWISTVGAAAARVSGKTDPPPESQPQKDSRTLWVQRCLTMYSVRTQIVLIFQHPTAVIHAQKTLLKVQRLLGSQAPVM